jgi:phasin family protein
MDMYKIESLAEINRAAYHNVIRLATLSLDNIERLAKFNLGAAKSLLADGAGSARAITGAKDIQALLAINAELTEAGVESALEYSRGVYGIESEAQAAFSALAEEAWAAYGREVAAWVEQAGKNAPAGSEAAVNVLKSTVAATAAAFDQLSRATKGVTSFADASVRAATDNAAGIAKAAASYRKAA